MNASSLMSELRAAGITVHADDGRIRLDAPCGTLTPTLLADVKSCKAELLTLLKLSHGPGVGGQCAAGVRAAPIETIAQTPADGDSYADREWARFERVAVRMADGGWYCPDYGGPEMPSGITGEQLDALVADCGRLGKGSRA